MLRGALWYPDNKIIFGDLTQGILRIPANGGNPEQLVKGVYVYPQLLPDGKTILLTDRSKQPFLIKVHALQSGKQKELFAGAAAHYLPTGHMVYLSGYGPYNIVAVPFDLEKLEATGAAVPIVNRVAGAAFSDSGTLLYLPAREKGSPAVQRFPVWVDQKGKEELIPGFPNMIQQNFALSPDGKKVAFVATTGGHDQIWIWDLPRRNVTQLTFDENTNALPLWTQDGRQIVYGTHLISSQRELIMRSADGTGNVQKLGTFSSLPIPSSWSGDGKSMIVEEAPGGVSMLSMEGDHSRKVLFGEKFFTTQPSVSRNGKWIAYVSTETGRSEIYVRPFPDIEKGKWRVSNAGGVGPLWSRDSRKLFYRNGDAVMAVRVETDPAFKAGTPEVLFHGNYYYWVISQGGMNPMWAISPDGRFMMVKEVKPDEKAVASETPRKINVVLNWFEELKQRVPVK
jgi:eukaryotic-like serine/threonine-protein kinase